MQKQTKLWTMRDGKKIRICDMDLDHLKNTIDMLERVAEKKYQENLNFMMSCPEPLGEMAQVDFDSAFEEILDTGAGDYLPEIYWDLIDDLERREWEARNE